MVLCVGRTFGKTSFTPALHTDRGPLTLISMGRGVASKGKREGGGPDWLKPAGADDGGSSGPSVQRVEEEKPKRRRNVDDDDLDEPPKKGIQWKPLAFLVLMVLPGLAPVLINVFDRFAHLLASPALVAACQSRLTRRCRWPLRSLQAYGFKMPSLSGSPYRPCLQEFYADWAPDKLGALDDTLSKYEGREKQLFGALKKKYGKPVNFARCTPPKEPKK